MARRHRRGEDGAMIFRLGRLPRAVAFGPERRRRSPIAYVREKIVIRHTVDIETECADGDLASREFVVLSKAGVGRRSE